MFANRSQFEARFFQVIRQYMSLEDVLRIEEGLASAVLLDRHCSSDTLLRPVAQERFPEAKLLGTLQRFDEAHRKLVDGEEPTSDIGNYKWCIEEFIGIDGLRDKSLWTKLYFVSLHTYCDWSEPSVANGDLLWLMVEAETVMGGTICADFFIEFIEWLGKDIPRSPDYNDYLLMLAWLLLCRLRDVTTKMQFDSVKARLIASSHTVADLVEIGGGGRDADAWFTLHQQIPLRYAEANEEFKKIIFGPKYSHRGRGL